MADATQTSEVIARSYVPETTVRAAPLTPEQQRNQGVADNLRQRLEAAAEDPLAALKPVEERPPLSVNLDKELDRRFGVEGAPKTADEQTRFDQAKTLGDAAKALTENGYESLTPDQQNELVASLTLNVLDRRPAFYGLAPDEKTAIAIDMLSNPTYQKKVGEILAGRLKPEEVIEASKPLIEAQTAFDEAQQALTNRGNERLGARVDLVNVEMEMDEFNATTKFGAVGGKFEELERLRADESYNRSEVDNTVDYLKVISGKSDADINLIKSQVAEKLARGEAITDPDERMISDMLDLQKDIDRIGELEIEHADLDKEGQRLNQRLLELPNEITEFQHTRDEKENELVDARNQKMLQEQSVIEGMIRVAPNAANEFLADENQKRAAEYQNQLKEMLDQTKDADEQRLIKKMQSRWDRAEIKGNNIRFTIKKEAVNKDMRALLVGDGPEGILKEMLTEDLRPRFRDSPEERARKTQEISRIEERIKTDKDFVKKYTDQIASSVLTKKIQSGRLYEGEIRVMVDRDWGEGAINQAIANDAKKRELIDKIYGSDSGSPSYVDRIKRKAGSNWLKFLMLFLVGGVAAGAITTKFVAQEGGR